MAIVDVGGVFLVVVQLGNDLSALPFGFRLAVSRPMLLQLSGAGIGAAQAVRCGRGLILRRFHGPEGGIAGNVCEHFGQSGLRRFQLLDVLLQVHFTRSWLSNVISW